MKKLLSIILALSMVLSLAACGGDNSDTGNKVKEVKTMTSENIKINAICVDDSYRDSENSSKRMVYVFADVMGGKSNFKVDSKSSIKFGEEGNEYSQQMLKDTAAYMMKNYHYSVYLKDVNVGETVKLAYAYTVPEAELTEDVNIYLIDDSVPTAGEIIIPGKQIQHFNSPNEIAEKFDAEGYAQSQDLQQPADQETIDFIHNEVIGYQWEFEAFNQAMEIEFFDATRFELRLKGFEGNGGTYTIKKGYISGTYDSNGQTVDFPYEIKDGKFSFKPYRAFEF